MSKESVLLLTTITCFKITLKAIGDVISIYNIYLKLFQGSLSNFAVVKAILITSKHSYKRLKVFRSRFYPIANSLLQTGFSECSHVFFVISAAKFMLLRCEAICKAYPLVALYLSSLFATVIFICIIFWYFYLYCHSFAFLKITIRWSQNRDHYRLYCVAVLSCLLSGNDLSHGLLSRDLRWEKLKGHNRK